MLSTPRNSQEINIGPEFEFRVLPNTPRMLEN
uniref:Uncharacterized protein n=1 Tax=Rhizophora mucronata TaxID=61149 RepID=A0A2P2NZ34_RHIMU